MLCFTIPRCLTAFLGAIAVFVNPGCVNMYGCITEGTLIATPEGSRPVESLKVGDPVWTLADSGEKTAGIVQATRSRMADSTIEIRTSDDHLLRVTPEQPLWINGEWTRARDLQPGHRLQSESNSTEAVSIMVKHERARVFDLSVEPSANYFAGGLLVHNKTLVPQFDRNDLPGTWIGVSPEGIWRMELTSDGTGRAIYTSGHYTVASVILSTSLDPHKYLISMTLEEQTETRRQFQLLGHAYRGRFEVAWNEIPDYDDRVIAFRREKDLQRDLNRLAEMMAKPSS